MTKINIIYPLFNHKLFLLIVYLKCLSNTFSFPFNNLQSVELNNGYFLMIHQFGIDICDKDLTKIIRKEKIFSTEEQISTPQKMQNVIIKKFSDGYLVCSIGNKIYIFDDTGQSLSIKENINDGKNVNYYTLDIKDNYHFFLGFMAESVLNIFYYEFNFSTGEIIKLAESGDISNTESWLWVFNTEYTFQKNGFDCLLMYNRNKGETLSCFFITSNSNKYYWNVEFLTVNGQSINKHPSYSSIRKEMTQIICGLFKVAVNSDKTKAFICSFNNNNYENLCFFYNTDQTDLYLDYINSQGENCWNQYYAFKINYFSEKNEFVFSCLGYSDNLKYVIYKFNNDNNLMYESFTIREKRCENFNGYNIFYSGDEEQYYIISDYTCNKTIYISNESSGVYNIEEKKNENEEEKDNEEEKEEENGEEKKIEIIEEIEKEKEELTIELQNKQEENEKGEGLIKEETKEKINENKETQEVDYYECKLEKCLKCDKNSEALNLCITCNELKNYYPLKNQLKKYNNYRDCFNSQSKPSNYFFNKEKKYYESCYETCKSCDYGGDSINNNCTECDYGYIFISGSKNVFNCMIKCQYYFYYTIDSQYKCTSSAICPENYFLLIRDKGQCIEDCSLDDEYKYQYDGECFKECPNNSSDNNDYKCLDNNINICSLSKKDININNDIIAQEEMDNLAKSYMKEFFYTDNHISLFDYSNYEIVLYKNFECISDLSLEIPRVNLGECYEKIKIKYDIEENLILLMLIQKKEYNKYPVIISFYVYSPYTGNQLNISNICEDKEIKVQEDIATKIADKEKCNYVHYLSQQNIDVFNLSSDFYHDICYYFNSPIKKDIALKDRIKIFFPNITLCENGCSIKGVNSTTMKAECECKINNLINNDAITNNAFYKNQIGNIEELLSESNLAILKCGSYLFKNRKITTFIGSFIILSFILLQISFTIFYFIAGVIPLKTYIIKIIDISLFQLKKKGNFPPRKTNISKKVKFINIINKEKGKESKHNNNNKNIYKHNNTEILKVNSRNSEHKSVRKDLITGNLKKGIDNTYSKNIRIHSISNKQIKIEDIIEKDLIEDNSLIKLSLKNEFKINFEEYLETDLGDIPFEEIIEKDNRTFCEYFKEQLKNNLLILNIIVNTEPLRPRTIKLVLFIINIDLYLIVNALFINEEFISDVYHSKKNNFFSFLPRSIDRVFYTTLVKVIVGYIIDFFFVEEKKIKIVLKSKRNTLQDIQIKIKEILNIVLNRFIYFIIFSFILTFFSLYYITCFNYRYYYITYEWIKSSVFIIIFMEILSILIILLESILRFISLKINSEKIYKLSLFFE